MPETKRAGRIRRSISPAVQKVIAVYLILQVRLAFDCLKDVMMERARRVEAHFSGCAGKREGRSLSLATYNFMDLPLSVKLLLPMRSPSDSMGLGIENRH